MRKTKRLNLRYGIKRFLTGAAMAAFIVIMGAGSQAVFAEDAESGYECGIKWTIDGDTLTIEPAGDENRGTNEDGRMKDYTKYPTASDSNSSDRPAWGGAKYDSVTKIVILDGVKNIGEKAFGTSQGRPKSNIDSVVIGSDVASIAEYAFANVTIPELTMKSYSISSDDISNMAFMCKTADPDKVELGVDKVNCFVGGAASYFEQFTKTDSAVEVSDSTTTYKYYVSDIDISNFNIKITSKNLLAGGDKVYIQWDGVSSNQEAEIVNDDIIPSSVLSEFMNNGYEASKLKLFDLSKTDDSIALNKATVKIPTPAAWADHHDTVKVYTYETDSEGKVSINEISGTTTASDYITFTTEHFSPYAMYYSYDDTVAEPPKYEISIDTSFFEGYYQWSISDGSATYDRPGKSPDKISNALNEFSNANNKNNSGYKVDTTHMKVFDLSAKIDGTETKDKIDGLRVRIPVPTNWNANVGSVQVLVITDGKITAINPLVTHTTDDKAYIEFTPPHFSSYALYYADAGTQATTTAATTASSTTTTVTSPPPTLPSQTSAGVQGTSANGTNGTQKPGYTGNGKYDNTPTTGVKDFMWIAFPAAVMLMGTGIVLLGRRKQKNIEE